ncbi:MULTISPECIES: hypothetical protein [Streptomyces]|uniref:Uncharacterized protein n=1 Tax=Streptomyces amritsarensis TaxID=681158 RepID=A0ABX3G1W6_9ACTN|nr:MULTISPECIES: hypothetical protein [Streptomyces]AQT70453.1 hypothetical protein B1K54_00585 [Streptomyces sp. fd1-xmd]OLZ65458.1 hypothetical protein AVW11_16790 [Streptomyces amritsarensis]
MTTVIEPERRQNPPTRHRRPAFDKKSLPARYTGQMLYFMGAALIAGAVVHYPIDPSLYAIICGVGAVVFLLGTIVNEFVLADERPAVGQAFSLVAFSLLLSFGVGMVGGGIQHFEQFPERSAWMTPIGLLMSYVAFVAKDSKGRWRHLVSPFAAVVVVISALTWLGMITLAGAIGSGGGHDHGSTTGTPAKPDQAPAESAPPSKAPAEPAQDGHSHSH